MGQEEDWNEGPEAGGAFVHVQGKTFADEHVTKLESDVEEVADQHVTKLESDAEDETVE